MLKFGSGQTAIAVLRNIISPTPLALYPYTANEGRTAASKCKPIVKKAVTSTNRPKCMAQTISGSLKTIAAQQLLFPQFRKRNGRSSRSLIEPQWGSEVVRGKGYLLLSAKRLHTSSHLSVSPVPRRIHSHSKAQQITYIPLVTAQAKPYEDSLESGFELMKRLSKIRRRHATEFQWSEAAPPKAVRPRLQISFALPSGSFFSEDSQDEDRPPSRLFTQDSMRKQLASVAIGDSVTAKPVLRHRGSVGGGAVDLRPSIYKRRSAEGR